MTPAEVACEAQFRVGQERDRARVWLVQVVGLAFVWGYIWLVIDPRLIYDAFGIYLPYPECPLDAAFVRETCSRPGGPVDYVSALLSQGFYFPVLGSFVVAAVSGLLCLATNRLFFDMGWEGGWLLGLAPAVGIVAMYRTYQHPLAPLLALAACLWMTAVFQKLPTGIGGFVRVGRAVVFLVACVGLYWLAGTVCVLFGLLVGVWMACVKRRWLAAAAAVAASAVTPWLIGTRWYYMTATEAYCVIWPFGPGSWSDMEPLPLAILQGLFLFPLAMVGILGLRNLLPQGLQNRLTAFAWWRRPILGTVTSLATLALALWLVHVIVRAPHREVRFKMVHFARMREWEEVLQAARQLRSSGHDYFSQHLVNRALFHTRQLGDGMFAFSQDPSSLLLLSGDVPHAPPKFWMLSEIAWELGDLNLAEQWAFERLEAVGECPDALELLALISLRKGQTLTPSVLEQDLLASSRQTARMFLRRMRKNLLHRRHAEALLEAIERMPLKGSMWPGNGLPGLRCEDRTFQTCSEELMLENLLAANPGNQMAFEYLMAYYLLSRRPDRLVQHLPRVKDFGYREIPRHYEEAILIHGAGTATEPTIPGLSIRPETAQRFQRFAARFQASRNQPWLAAADLAEEFGDSYFYYHVFGVSGVGRAR